MTRTSVRLSLLAMSLGMAFSVHAQDATRPRGLDEALARLNADIGAASDVAYHNATGSARFVRLGRGNAKFGSRALSPATDAAKQDGSNQFLRSYGALFGMNDAGQELSAPRVTKDRQGGTHFSHRQMYRGLPVFGAELKTHFDAAGNLTVANGTFVPGIAVDPTPQRSAEQAGQIAVKRVLADLGRQVQVSPTKTTLMVYREGLAQGVPGDNHLAWEVVVGNGVDVRDFVYVDAHTGKIIDKVAGIHDAKNRRAFDGANAPTAPGPNYPQNPFWVEGQAFPTGTAEADNMIAASSDIYDLFKNAFGRDSFDGKGATMDSIFNRGWGCVNASWNGQYISFCPGTTADDITAHEWGHAYTEYTHGLIYAWQPGALNEAYSDIWGETVDRINGRGTDTPDTARSPGVCVVNTNPPAVTITAPAAIAGAKATGIAGFGPGTFSLSGTLQAASPINGCTAMPAGSLNGKIAYIDRGTCSFSQKAANAEAAGAIGVLVGNSTGGTIVQTMGATAGFTNTIPAMMVSQNTGTAIKGQLAAGTTVSVNMVRPLLPTYNTVRWLLGEDSTAFGGAIRDMYNPTCFGNPGKVSDAQYSCGPNTSAGDNGGVHNNSGVANHGYALLVDGGAYNGQNITGIGLTKAAHIYYRAQSVYQGPATDFAAHADALEQSCRDLRGVNLNDLKTGAPSGEVITDNDCAQVSAMALAVEFRTPPAQCQFQPLLAKNPPALCDAGTASSLLADNFEGGRRGGVRWQTSHVGSNPEFTPRDWSVVTNLPGKRAGYAIFASDYSIGTCAAGGDQSGVQRLDSPEFTIPTGTNVLRMTFDHFVATESTWDGGNVKVSVNGGAWQVVAAADFVYNAYNTSLLTLAQQNSNPMAGEPAFSGTDAGSVTGSWGRSIINLAPYAKSGDKVRIRFELGNDGCGGVTGWYLDDINVYRCTP